MGNNVQQKSTYMFALIGRSTLKRSSGNRKNSVAMLGGKLNGFSQISLEIMCNKLKYSMKYFRQNRSIISVILGKFNEEKFTILATQLPEFCQILWNRTYLEISRLFLHKFSENFHYMRKRIKKEKYLSTFMEKVMSIHQFLYNA